MSLAVEAKLGALFFNTKQVAPLQQIFIKLGHLQPLMPVQTDILMAFGIVTNKIIPKATKAMHMWYHWLHECNQQQQFWFYWQMGKTNFTNYWTKHHAATHHRHMQQFFPHQASKQLQHQANGGEDEHIECKTEEQQTQMRPSTTRKRTKNGICHRYMPEQLQGCARIPKLPKTNRVQWPGKGKIDLMSIVGQGQMISKWEVDRCFHVER